MIRIPGRIPVSISNFFWLTAAFIGWIYSRSLIGTIIWIGIIFVSILWHEFGHALTSKFFGQKPRIELIAFGGLTYPEGPKLPLWKEFIVVFNGPLFGFSLFILAIIILKLPHVAESGFANFLQTFRIVNLFWTVVNLLPVLPLDGGQLVRIIFESIFHAKGFRYALLASMVIAFGISLMFFFMQGFLIGALFFLFAFQNFETWRKTRGFSEADQSDSLKNEMAQIEVMMQQGNKTEAEARLTDMRNKSKSGMIFVLATQYLAGLKYSSGSAQEAYDLLKREEKHLSYEYQVLLQQAAFDVKDYQLVSKLAGLCFQKAPSADIAIRSAIACAEQGQVTPAIGWLKAAMKEGLVNIDSVISKPHFDQIRKDPEFEAFVTKNSGS